MIRDTRSGSKSFRFKDDSVTDVTGKSVALNKQSYLKKYGPGVPAWDQHYIYSYSEIYKASPAQRNFYLLFKINFLNGVYFDLEGNNNYAFILLFDFFDEYETHKSQIDIQKHLLKLGYMYPETRSYTESFITKKRQERNLADEQPRFAPKKLMRLPKILQDLPWHLGNAYKDLLKLNKEEVSLLNKLWNPDNAFWKIRQTGPEIIKLFLTTIESLKEKYAEEGTDLDVQFHAISVLISKYHYRYRPGSNNYKLSIESTTTDIYSTIFKLCENVVRDHYDHKRRINTNLIYANSVIIQELETRVLSKVREIIAEKSEFISLPTDATEKELNAQSPNRWKSRFKKLTDRYASSPKRFFDDVLRLAKLNERNPEIQEIYYDASRFISAFDRETALKLYVYYLYCDLKTVNTESLRLSKTVQKKLFENKEQLHNFERLISELIIDKDLDKAIAEVQYVYKQRRKQIKLDSKTIESVINKHSGTVDLLNDYLRDEYEDDNNYLESQQINDEEIRIDITQKSEEPQFLQKDKQVVFTPTQLALLDLFLKNNYALWESDLEAFAKSKGVFKNQLIDSLNEATYELFDDILIEEEEGIYLLNANYYHRLFAI